MSLEVSTSKVVYQGNGSTKVFSFPFKVWKASQVRVMLANSEGSETDVTSQVSVALTAAGGTVTFGSAPAEGTTLAILRAMPFVQEDRYITGTRFDPHEIEEALDVACAERQELRELALRHLTVPATSSKTPQQVMTEIFGTVATANEYAVQAEKTYEATQETKKAVDARAAEVEVDRQAVAADRQAVVAVADVVQGFKDEVLDYADEMTTVAENISDINVVRQNVGGIQALAADIQGYPIYEFDGGWLDEPNEPMNGIAGGVLKTNADAIEDIKVVAEAVEGGVFEGLEGTGGVLATLAQNIDTLLIIGEAVKSGTLDQYVTKTEYALGFNGGTL